MNCWAADHLLWGASLSRDRDLDQKHLGLESGSNPGFSFQSQDLL